MKSLAGARSKMMMLDVSYTLKLIFLYSCLNWITLLNIHFHNRPAFGQSCILTPGSRGTRATGRLGLGLNIFGHLCFRLRFVIINSLSPDTVAACTGEDSPHHTRVLLTHTVRGKYNKAHSWWCQTSKNTPRPAERVRVQGTGWRYCQYIEYICIKYSFLSPPAG